jgi:hypothetical protein
MSCIACGPFGFYAAAQPAPRHGDGGFRNNYPHPAKESFWTFESLTDEALDEPPAELARLRERSGLPREAFDVMAISETRPIARGNRP